MMKKLKKYLLLALLCLPLALQAQVASKYLAGAVPVIDGKVTFSTEIKAKGLTKSQIYQTALDWANKRFQPTDGLQPRVLYTDADKGEIITNGEEYIVFSSSYVALDRTRIYYHLIINCADENCRLTMTRIHYWYEEDVDGGYKYKAEKWITDQEGLNKSKTKLAKVSGKFRQKTIDYKDMLFKELETRLNGEIVENINNGASATPKAETVKIQPTVKTVPKKKTDNQEEAIKNAVRITITAGNDEQFEINRESWGGFGEFFGKKVTFCLLDTQKTMGNMLMNQSDTYRIKFYSSDNQPVLTVSCKKLMAQTIDGKEAQKMSSSCDKSKSYNLYVGEIIE